MMKILGSDTFRTSLNGIEAWYVESYPYITTSRSSIKSKSSSQALQLGTELYRTLIDVTQFYIESHS
jgi:hypothetical protein